MGNNGLLIRDACPDELGAIARLLRDAYQQYERSLPHPRWELYLEDIMDVRSRLPVSQLIVAEMNGQLAGSVTLYLKGSLSSEDWPEDWASVRLLAVHPDFRGFGIGHALMEECVRRSREQGIKTIALHTSKLMDIARKMYERMGFKRVPKYDFHPAPGIVAMAYRLDL